MTKHIVTREKYWTVKIGRLNWANGPASYQFPTERAAMRFARHNTGRSVRVVNQYGRTVFCWKGVPRA